MMVVSDLDDVFVPLPDDLLVNLSESRTVVESFLDSLPSMFQDNVNVESAFGPALKAAFMVMVCYLHLFLISHHFIFVFLLLLYERCYFLVNELKYKHVDNIVNSTIIKLTHNKEFYITIPSVSFFILPSLQSQLGGKLLIFQNTLPSLGVGRLKLRGDDLRVYGTDKEHLLRLPEDPFYKQMAAEFTKFQIGVNVYAFSDKYTDIASLGMLKSSLENVFVVT